MQQTCATCQQAYDDADRSTICPHPLLMPRELLAQKDLGLSLLGKLVVFKHGPVVPPMRVLAVGWEGMVTVDGFTGEFAPQIFEVVPSESGKAY